MGPAHDQHQQARYRKHRTTAGLGEAQACSDTKPQTAAVLGRTKPYSSTASSALVPSVVSAGSTNNAAYHWCTPAGLHTRCILLVYTCWAAFPMSTHDAALAGTARKHNNAPKPLGTDAHKSQHTQTQLMNTTHTGRRTQEAQQTTASYHASMDYACYTAHLSAGSMHGIKL